MFIEMDGLLVQNDQASVCYFAPPTKGSCYVRSSRISKEVHSYLCANLLRTKIWAGDDEILDLPVERDLLDRLKGRVELAREIDRIQHGATKENHDKNWLKVTAEALEIDFSDEE